MVDMGHDRDIAQVEPHAGHGGRGDCAHGNPYCRTPRSLPDVSYNAGVDGGVLVHLGAINVLFGLDPTDASVFFIVGGTSAGSPQWAGLGALADQLAGHRLGDINPALYQIGKTAGLHGIAYHDITVGSNRFGFNDGTNDIIIPGFSAKVRWDAATGWGTPKANVLVPLIAALSH